MISSSKLPNCVIAMGQKFIKLLNHSLTWIFELIRVTYVARKINVKNVDTYLEITDWEKCFCDVHIFDI